MYLVELRQLRYCGPSAGTQLRPEPQAAAYCRTIVVAADQGPGTRPRYTPVRPGPPHRHAHPGWRGAAPTTWALLEQADELRRVAAGLAAYEPVRLGYVSWRPADLTSRTAGVAQLLVDAWVLPHTQATRVADGSIDLAICWSRPRPRHLRSRSPAARRRPALRGRPGTDTSPVRARDTAVLVDANQTSWLSWDNSRRSSWPTPAPPAYPSTTAASPAQRLRPCTTASPPIGQLARGQTHQSRRTWSSGRSSRLRRTGPGP